LYTKAKGALKEAKPQAKVMGYNTGATQAIFLVIFIGFVYILLASDWQQIHGRSTIDGWCLKMKDDSK
jgi:hypothetical protein